MLIQYKQVSMLIERAQDEAFVKLADDVQLDKVSFAKHLTQLVITNHDVLCIFTIP